MWLKLMRVLAPFSQIARELTIIRELYEAELASYNPPIIRITEKPKKSDTTVTYMGDEPKKTMVDKLKHLLGEVEDEDDTQNYSS
jgi:hypothetical protein